MVSLPRVANADIPPALWQSGGLDELLDVRPDPPGGLKLSIDSQTPVVLPLHGPSTGLPYALTCGPDELVVGLWGRAELSIDMMGLYCARMLPNGMLQPAEQRNAVGTAMTAPFSLSCPKHEAVIGLRGRASTKIDRLGLGCARVRPWKEQGIRGAVLQSVGGTSGSAFTDECPRGYLLQGMIGYSNSAVNSVQGLCVPIVNGQ